MGEKYYVVREKAVPEVLLKVLEVKKIMKNRKLTIQQAVEQVGISRSSFYKYQDDIFPLHDNVKGQTVTFMLQMEDEPGILSKVLQSVAAYHGNILTIHQSIPINGVATLTISVDIPPEVGDTSAMMENIEAHNGVHDIKILGRE